MRAVAWSYEQLLHEAGCMFYQSGYDALSFKVLAGNINCPEEVICFHFRDREDLLKGIIRTYGYRHLNRAVSGILKPDACTIRARLMRFAIQLLLVLREEESVLGILRRIVSDVPSRGLAGLSYEAGLRQAHEILTDVIDNAMQHREIRLGDPGLLSRQFFALLNSFIEIKLLHNRPQRVSLCQIRKSARDSVDLFLHGALVFKEK